MTPKNAGTLENPAAPSDQQPPAKPKPEKARRVRAPKKKKEIDDLHLPVFVEFTYTVSILFVIFASLTIMVTSIITGASLLSLVLRTSIGILVLGVLVTLISSQISSGMLAASLAEKEEFEKAQAEEAEQAEKPEQAKNIEDTLQAEA